MSQKKNLSQMELDGLMLSQEDSLVRTSHWQENARELVEKGLDYGANVIALLAKYNQSTHCLKMSQISLLETMEGGLKESYQTWPRSGMMQNGTVYELKPFDPIQGIEFGLWPTPQKFDGSMDQSYKSTMERLKKDKQIMITHIWTLGTGQHKTPPSFVGVADGFSDGPHRLAACGNAVLPQIPELIGRAIMEVEA